MTSIAYFMVGFSPAAQTLLTMLLIGFLVEQVGVAMGTMLSALTPTFAVAISLGGPLLTLFSLTGGYVSYRVFD